MNNEISELLKNANIEYENKNYKESVKLYENYLLENLKIGNKEIESIVSYRLAIYYLKGIGTRRNISNALFHLDVISDVDSDAAYLLGVCYTLGLYVRPSYAVAFKYFKKAYTIQASDWLVNYGYPYSILVGDIYQYGIGVKQDEIFALYKYADGIRAYACIFANRIEYFLLKDDEKSKKFKEEILKSLKHFEKFSKDISDMILDKDYQVNGAKKEISEIAKLSIKDTKESYQGDKEANIKIIYSLLLSKDYKKHLPLIYRLLNINTLKMDLHSAFLLGELAFKEKQITSGINKSLIALHVFKNKIISSIKSNLKDEINNPLYSDSRAQLELGFNIYEKAVNSLNNNEIIEP